MNCSAKLISEAFLPRLVRSSAFSRRGFAAGLQGKGRAVVHPETTFRVGRREVDEDKGRMSVTKRETRGTEREREGMESEERETESAWCWMTDLCDSLSILTPTDNLVMQPALVRFLFSRVHPRNCIVARWRKSPCMCRSAHAYMGLPFPASSTDEPSYTIRASKLPQIWKSLREVNHKKKKGRQWIKKKKEKKAAKEKTEGTVGTCARLSG